MYRYVGDISNLSHEIIKNYCYSYGRAVDATLGNGHDTNFLSKIFKEVTSFEVQRDAVDAYLKNKENNVTVINASHEYLTDYCKESVNCFMYNLGFLPGGDKNITTKADTTIKSLKQAIKLLSPGGIISIALYIGHEEGKREAEEVIRFVKNLSKVEYGVMQHSFLNRSNEAPMLLIIEKNLK